MVVCFVLGLHVRGVDANFRTVIGDVEFADDTVTCSAASLRSCRRKVV